jgi:hypothetical protein
MHVYSPLQTLRKIDEAMAAILVLTFLVFMAVVALNLFIALLSNTFQRVYDNAQSIAVLEQVRMVHGRKRTSQAITSLLAGPSYFESVRCVSLILRRLN